MTPLKPDVSLLQQPSFAQAVIHALEILGVLIRQRFAAMFKGKSRIDAQRLPPCRAPVELSRFHVRMTGVIVAVLLSVSSALAGASEDCAAAYDRQDYVLALRLCRPLAEQGDIDAQTAVGNLYYEGWGVEQNYTSAANWFRKAAEEGDATGQFSLGWAYEQGDGVLQDYVLAHMWYNLAAAQGADVAAKDRDRVAAKMTSDQIAEAQRVVRGWKPTK